MSFVWVGMIENCSQWEFVCLIWQFLQVVSVNDWCDWCVCVVVVFGGCSNEYVILCVFVGSILCNLDLWWFDVIVVGIILVGLWVFIDVNFDVLMIINWEFFQVKLGLGIELVLLVDLWCGGQLVLLLFGVGEVLELVDVVFLVLYGLYGEDGMIQGLFEFVGVFYVGVGVLVSVVGMDKEFIKKLFVVDGFLVGVYVVLCLLWLILYCQECEWLGLLVFVKFV